MGNGDDRALVLLQVLLQPVDALGVEMIGGLVQKEHIGLLEKQTTEGHTAAFASGQVLHEFVRRRAAQGVHGSLELGFNLPSVHGLDLFGKFSLLLEESVHYRIVYHVAQMTADLVVAG